MLLPGRNRRCKVIRVAIGITFLLILLCQEATGPALGSAERAVIEYLSNVYEQPLYGWFEGKFYFLPEEAGLELLASSQLGAEFEGLKFYRASVWTMHWGPERFHVYVWVVRRPGGLRFGVLEGSGEVADEIPGVLGGFVFDSLQDRREIAFLIGQMMAGFYGERAIKGLVLSREGACERLAWPVTRSGEERAMASVCFSSEGVLERITRVPRRKMPAIDLNLQHLRPAQR